jgi:hypothetical protein
MQTDVSKMKQKIVFESDDPEIINQLWNSKEWCMPRWSESKGKYIMIRRKASIGE